MSDQASKQADTDNIEDAVRSKIINECIEIIHRYSHYADLGRRSLIPDLFTEDGVLGFPGQPIRGRRALRDHFSLDQPDRTTVHVCTNTVIDVVSLEEARGITYLTVYAVEGEVDPYAPVDPPVRVGYYTDQIVKVDGHWRFRERAITFLLGRRTGSERTQVPRSVTLAPSPVPHVPE